jgi:hypothetical protein
VLVTFKNALVHRVGPMLGRWGWRPSRATPLREGYLGATFGYDEESEIKDAVRRVRDHTMVSFERLATLWQQVRYLDRYEVPGALVECGTWRGGAVGMMALAHVRSSREPIRPLHLFDSFEGLPEPTAADGPMASRYSRGRTSGALDTIGACEAPLEDNRALLEDRIGYPADLLAYHVGWFQDTVAASAAGIGPIALLRLDGDWYESTRVCLTHLYPLVAAGGVVVVDDYGHWEGCRKAVDEFLAVHDEPILLSHIDYTGRYWIKPR